jgi:hypothetical protein
MNKLIILSVIALLIFGCATQEQKEINLNGIFEQFARENYALNSLLTHYELLR